MKAKKFVTTSPCQFMVLDEHEIENGECKRKCATPEMTVCVQVAKFDGGVVAVNLVVREKSDE